jgi:flavin reductase (DIM6/NTAB) family NADH-FMN oxidoreductase RutF
VILDPETLRSRERYDLLISAIVPRPIAFVTSLSPSGVVNLAPFSFFQGVAVTPPTVMIAISRKAGGALKDTWGNIAATRDYVIHGVTEDLLEAVVIAAAEWPAEVSEVDKAGLELTPSDRVRTPRLAAAKVAFECRLDALHEVHGVGLVLGEVLRAHVDDELLVPGKVEIDNNVYRPIARLGSDLYLRGGEILRRPRRRVEDLA